LRVGVCMALVKKGVTLGRGEEEIAVYDDVVARFDPAADPSLKEIVDDAKARRNAVIKGQREKKSRK
jgi:hypothetical protein